MKQLQLTEKEIRQLSDLIAHTIFTHYIDREYYRSVESDEEAKELTDDDLNTY